MVDGNYHKSNNQPRRSRGNYYIDESDDFQTNRPSRSSQQRQTGNSYREPSANDYQEDDSAENVEYTRRRTGGNYYYRGNQPNRRQVDQWDARMARPADNRDGRYSDNRTRSQRQNKGAYRRLAGYSLKKDLAGWPKGKTTILAVYGILFLAMIWAGFAMLPFDQVNQVQVAGTEYIQPETIVKASGILPTDKTTDVLNQKNQIETAIKDQLLLVNKIAFDDSNWRHLVITVDENNLVGRLTDSTYLLSNGQAISADQIRAIDSRGASLPLVSAQNENQVTAIAGFLNQLTDAERAQIDTVTGHPERNHVVDLQMSDGNEVRGTTQGLYQKMQYYDQMVQIAGDRTGLFNLEVGAYFTPHNSPDNSVKLDNNIDN